MNVQEIVPQLHKTISQLLSAYPVLLAYLYGSLARDEYTTLSDIDIALVTKQTLSPLDRLDLELDIEIELANLGFSEADVRVINNAPPEVRGRVVAEGALLYSLDEDQRADFERKALAQYHDLQPILRERLGTYVQSALADLRTRGLCEH